MWLAAWIPALTSLKWQNGTWLWANELFPPPGCFLTQCFITATEDELEYQSNKLFLLRDFRGSGWCFSWTIVRFSRQGCGSPSLHPPNRVFLLHLTSLLSPSPLSLLISSHIKDFKNPFGVSRIQSVPPFDQKEAWWLAVKNYCWSGGDRGLLWEQNGPASHYWLKYPRKSRSKEEGLFWSMASEPWSMILLLNCFEPVLR